MTTANQIHRGMAITYKDQLYTVKDFQNTMPGKGGAFIQATLKSPTTGKIINVRFRSSETVDVAFVATKVMQFLYEDDTGYIFMDMKTFEQTTLQKDLLGKQGKYLTDTLEVRVSFHEDNPLLITLPSTVEMEITFTAPGEKGDSATNTLKPATVDAGFEIQVPLFIKTGDRISIHTETGEYAGKVN